MRPLISRYETEIRLGLLVIVVLLLILNIGTAYVIHRAKRQITERLDARLTAAVNFAELYVRKNFDEHIESDMELPPDQARPIEQKYGLRNIYIKIIRSNAESLDLNDVDNLLESTGIAQKIDEELYGRLLQGQKIYLMDDSRASRFAVSLLSPHPYNSAIIAASVDGETVAVISQASRTAFYMAVGLLLIVIPLTIFLPQLILSPFKKMYRAAQSSGRLAENDDGDEVSEVVKSYEQIIGELKKREEELKRLYSESSSRADRLKKVNQWILRSIKSGVIYVDLTGHVVGYNHAANEILGYDESSVIGKRYQVAFPDETEISLIIEAGLERGESIARKEVGIERPGRETLWIGIESSQIFDDSGRAVGISLLFNDLTEIRKLQKEIEINRQMAALGEMTGGLAHQLRNSLGAISGFCQLLRKKVGDFAELQDIVDSIINEAKDSEAMVSRFLNFARPLSLAADQINFVTLLDELIDQYGQEFVDKKVDLNTDIPFEELNIMGDELLLKEALSNVIDNALEASGKRGKVFISVAIEEKKILLEIRDSGPGISAKYRDKLFTPFVSSKPSGTGLGLALTRKIINLHDGAITIDSIPSGGAICHIELPCPSGTGETEDSGSLRSKKV